MSRLRAVSGACEARAMPTKASLHSLRAHRQLPAFPQSRLPSYSNIEAGRRVATQAADSSASASGTSLTSGGLQVLVRPIQGAQELQAAANLRAEAYHEGNNSRFVGSLKRQFAEQEVESLRTRTGPSLGGGAPVAECLVALEGGDSGSVLACIDTRLPRAVCGVHPQGVPAEDANGAYLLNVVVSEDHRGMGVGRCLMQEATRRAVGVWNAQRLYTSVEATNDVAIRLYTSCGFSELSADSAFESALKLGQTKLLIASAEDVGHKGQ